MEDLGRKMYVIHTLNAINRKWGKNYCFPSQDKLIELIRKYYSCKICKRTLNYWLRDLEDKGYLERKRRICRGKDGRLTTDSTLYKLCHKAYKWLYRFVRVSILGKLSSFTKEKKAPSLRDVMYDDGSLHGEPLPLEENLRRLGKLIADLG